ncbi:MAG: hypothetical protein IPN01_23280 [Deltaproteobacteria bacterium]|nr:hypothetical protein [Deltaproteobacteria bacterium]
MKAGGLRELQVRLRFAPDDVREVGQLAERGRGPVSTAAAEAVQQATTRLQGRSA